MTIEGKHIVLTGGTSGIGLELVKQLYGNNDLSVFARPSSALQRLRRDFDRITIFEADLSDIKAVEAAADQMVKSEKPIDILINNAAVQHTPRFLDEDFRLETIRHEIDTNFTSVCTLVYLLLPNLMDNGPSTILNVNSGLALAPKTSSAVYCATKAALDAFSQSLGYQLEDTNIDVKQVFLPMVDTAMTEGRGSGKLSPKQAASGIIRSLSTSSATIDLGKVKLLRTIRRFSPRLAARIMKAA